MVKVISHDKKIISFNHVSVSGFSIDTHRAVRVFRNSMPLVADEAFPLSIAFAVDPDEIPPFGNDSRFKILSLSRTGLPALAIDDRRTNPVHEELAIPDFQSISPQ